MLKKNDKILILRGKLTQFRIVWGTFIYWWYSLYQNDTLKWIVPQGDLFSKLFTFLQHVFLVCFNSFRKIVMIDGGVAFYLYSDDYFDKRGVLFNSRICV